MYYYRFYMLDSANRIVAREGVYCADNAEAFEKARALCKAHEIEIWQGTTKVGTISCEKPRGSSAGDGAPMVP